MLEMLTASVENMLVTSIDTTLETGVVSTQYIVIISTIRRQSEVGIQCWIDVGPIVNFCLGRNEFQSDTFASVVFEILVVLKIVLINFHKSLLELVMQKSLDLPLF